MKNKNYHIVGTILKSNRIITERGIWKQYPPMCPVLHLYVLFITDQYQKIY
jgi:hypothetical protein